MRVAQAPKLHLFVCANHRGEGSPLGPGCGARGERVYDALKAEVSRRRLVVDVWVTKTHCLGICPKAGATVARYPHASPVVTEVDVSDVETLLAASPAAGLADVLRELTSIEELQTKKVLDLARRLKPGLTLEDVQNPHDFPELDDPDWHYADGMLTGIKSATIAVRALEGGNLRKSPTTDAEEDR